MHEMWEALKDFHELKPFLKRRLAYIIHSRRDVELAQEMEEVRFYLNVMKDLAVFPRSHATDQVRSYIRKIHDILRKGPVPPDFQPIIQLPSPPPQLERVSHAVSGMYGEGGREVGVGRGRGRPANRVELQKPTHFAQTVQASWNQGQYNAQQSFERHQPTLHQTIQPFFGLPVPRLQDTGYAVPTPQYYAQPQLIPVPYSMIYPSMIPPQALVPYYSVPQSYGQSPYFPVNWPCTPSAGVLRSTVDPDFNLSVRKHWRANSRTPTRRSRSSTPVRVAHAPVDRSPPVAPAPPSPGQETTVHRNSTEKHVRRQVTSQAAAVTPSSSGAKRSEKRNGLSTRSLELPAPAPPSLDKETPVHQNPSEQDVRRQVTSQAAAVTPSSSGAKRPEKRISPSIPTPTRSKVQEVRDSPSSSTGIRRSALTKIPASKAPVVTGVRPGYRIPKVGELRQTSSSAPTVAPAPSGRSVSESPASCSSRRVDQLPKVSLVQIADDNSAGEMTSSPVSIRKESAPMITIDLTEEEQIVTQNSKQTPVPAEAPAKTPAPAEAPAKTPAPAEAPAKTPATSKTCENVMATIQELSTARPLTRPNSTEEVTSTSTADPEKESSSPDPEPFPVSSSGNPKPSTSLQPKKKDPTTRKKSSGGNQPALKKLYAALEESNYDPLKLLESARRTRSGTLIGPLHEPNEFLEQARATVATLKPKKKSATVTKKNAGTFVKKKVKVIQAKIKVLTRKHRRQKSRPPTLFTYESTAEGESLDRVTRARADRMKRKQEEQASRRRMYARFVRYLQRKVVGPRDIVVNTSLNKIKIEDDYVPVVKEEPVVPQVEQEYDDGILKMMEDYSQKVVYVHHEVDLDDGVQ